MLQSLVHYSLHFLVIGGIAYWYDQKHWKKYWLILLATMLVDLDHLAATPIFQSDRCSIGFHFLHSYYATFVYFLGAVFLRHRVLKIIAIGLLFHMFTDFVDCVWMLRKCETCEVSEIFSRMAK